MYSEGWILARTKTYLASMPTGLPWYPMLDKMAMTLQTSDISEARIPIISRSVMNVGSVRSRLLMKLASKYSLSRIYGSAMLLMASGALIYISTIRTNGTHGSEGYRSFILLYAEMAEQAEVEMFCIGTELTRLSKNKPEFWRSLIKDVKAVYKGKLTYAGNWYKEYESISFWDELDYIGIQAYFPLTNKDNPDVAELKQYWERKSSDLAGFSAKFNKPILFTEIGYKSTIDGASKPWEWIDYYNNGATFEQSFQTQSNAYQSVFETVWHENWFAGMHLWQWRGDGRNRRDRNRLDFTPQNKPAEQIIAAGFKL